MERGADRRPGRGSVLLSCGQRSAVNPAFHLFHVVDKQHAFDGCFLVWADGIVVGTVKAEVPEEFSLADSFYDIILGI